MRDFVLNTQVADPPEITSPVAGTPGFDSQGEFTSYRSTAREITPAKASEGQLQAIIQSLDRVQRIAGIASLAVDLRSERISWSAQACALFGIAPEITDSTEEFLLGFIHPDDRKLVYDAGKKANVTGTVAPPLEYRIVRPDRTERFVYRENAIEVDENGTAVRRIITYQDITDFKNTEARLRETMNNLERA